MCFRDRKSPTEMHIYYLKKSTTFAGDFYPRKLNGFCGGMQTYTNVTLCQHGMLDFVSAMCPTQKPYGVLWPSKFNHNRLQGYFFRQLKSCRIWFFAWAFLQFAYGLSPREFHPFLKHSWRRHLSPPSHCSSVLQKDLELLMHARALQLNKFNSYKTHFKGG